MSVHSVSHLALSCLRSSTGNELQDEAGIEPGCATGATPRTSHPARDPIPAAWTGIDVLAWPPLWRNRRAANHVQADAGQFGDAVGHAIIAMLRVAAEVSIQSIPHVDQLFRHHDFDGAWLSAVDSGKVDENQVLSAARIERVGSAD